MNVFLKNKIIENEKKLLDNFPEYKQSIFQFIKKIEKCSNDSMLLEIIVSSFSSESKKNQIKKYNESGFVSAYELINSNLESLDLSEKITLDNIIDGNLYNPFEICSIAKNYNNQVGMYYINDSNVIIKSTVEDNNRPYDDRWLKKDIILKYFMQKEKEINLSTLIFSNKPNVTIFNSLMEGYMINIHVFINTKKGDKYKYCGIFHPCGLVSNNKAFILFKHGYDSEVPFDNLEAQFIYSLLKDNKYPEMCNFNLISVEHIKKSSVKSDIGHLKTSKRNIIQNMKIQLEVNLRGEDLVLHYERNKLIKLGYKNLAELVENVSLYDDSLGYDIKSFEVLKDGSVKEIYIKIKTSVSANVNSFELSAKELENLTYNPDKYKLYRVYDIYTDKPKFYQVFGLPANNYNITPSYFGLVEK